MSRDLERRRVRASVENQLFGGEAAWPRVGRFEIVAKVGSGATGVVYKAYDPRLDRHVALKLLNADRVAAGRDRFLREARTLAKLSHPNIIAIHDVGDVGDAVFITTELIEGVDLRRWLDLDERDPKDVLPVFLAAGRGLGAAHRAGIVHRDFKPANVMIGDDGRVCVVDFGLARTALEAHEIEPGRRLPSSSALTHTGLAVGTPLYMAPEQWRGAPDTRSDQFSYCVALYEALYGVHPFDGATLDELIESVHAGPRPPPSTTRAPKHAWEALARGLAPEPDQRHASMFALLRVLERDPASVRRRATLAAGVVVTAFVLGGAAVWGLRDEQPSWQTRCDAAADAAAGSLWNDERSALMADSFAATEHPRYAALFERTAGAFARYADGIRRAHSDACAATRVRGSQSEDLLDLRMACVARMQTEADALARLLIDTATADLVFEAPLAAAELSTVSACADLDWLRGKTLVPHDSDTRERVLHLAAAIDDAHARFKAGKDHDALAAIRPLVEATQHLADPSLRARAAFIFADLLDRTGDSKAGAEQMRLAIREAATAGDTRLVVRAWNALLWAVGYELSERAELPAIELSLESALELAGRPPELVAAVDYTFAWLAYVDRDFGLATARAQSSLQGAREVYGDTHPLAVDAQRLLGNILHDQGRYREALDAYQQALRYGAAVYGEDDPRSASTYSAIGLSARELGDLDAALVAHRRAVELAESRFGPDNPAITIFLSNLGGTLARLGEFDEAIVTASRAVRIRERTLGRDHAKVADALNDLAAIYSMSRDFEAAARAHRRALAIRESALGPNDFMTGVSANNLADTLSSLEQYAESAKHAERALTIFEAKLGPDHINVAYPLISIGVARMHQGDPSGAIEPLERALRIRERHEVAATTLAGPRFALAEALWAAKRDRERARQLATQARDDLAAAGPGEAANLAEVEQWLAEHLDDG